MNYRLINQIDVEGNQQRMHPGTTVLICSGGIIGRNDTFLFGKRAKNKDWAPGLWDIVGGKALKEENPLLTLYREVLEETNIRVLNAELLTIGDVSVHGSDQPLFRYYIYFVSHSKGKAINQTSEHVELRWFTRLELNGLALALPEYLNLIDRCIAR